MNFFLEALQDEHIILSKAVESYKEQISKLTPIIKDKISKGEIDKVILAGMGSSLYASKSILAKMNKAGIFTISVNAFEVLHYQSGLITKDSLVILISQSGDTKEMVQLSELIKDKAAMTIAMLNVEDCAMNKLCDYNLFTKMGQETPISNKSYYGQAAMLNMLAGSLIGDDINQVGQDIQKACTWADQYVKDQEKRTRELIDFMGEPNHVDMLGDDAAMGVALQTGLIWRECMKESLSIYSSSDYSHGWYGTLKEGDLLVIYTDQLNWLEKNVFDYALEHGAKVILFSKDEAFDKRDNLLQVTLPDVDNSVLPLYAIVPGYFVAGFLMK